MKSILITVIIVIGLTFCRAQTADDYVTQGRSFLQAHDVVTANARFALAVGLSPNHETANLYLAVTRLLVLPEQPAGGALLDRLGFNVGSRNVYQWTADVAKDTNGIPYAPANVFALEISTFIRTDFMSCVVAAEGNLQRISDTNFAHTLSAAETSSTDVTVDYGDIQMLRAGLKFSEYLSCTTYAWNLDTQLAAIRLLLTGDQTVGEFLEQNQQFLTFATTNDLAQARDAFSDMVDLYVSASEFIRSRPTNTTCLFNVDADQLELEAKFRTTLLELQESLNGPVVLSSHPSKTIEMRRHFDGVHSMRSFLPEFTGDSMIAGSLPDSTFGGLIGGLPGYKVEEGLASRWSAQGLSFPGIPFVSRFSLPQKLADGRFSMALDGIDDTAFLIQVSTNLQTWEQVCVAPVFHGKITFTNNGTGSSQEYYRAVDLSDRLTVSGTVINVADESPITNATVTLTFNETLPGAATQTDRNGNYALISAFQITENDWYGYTIDATANGFEAFQDSSWSRHLVLPIYLAPVGYRPPNDDFAARQLIVGSNAVAVGYNVGGTREFGEPQHGERSIWWTWTAPASGAVIMQVTGSPFYPGVSVYTGNSIGTLTAVPGGTRGFYGTKPLNFFVTAGVTYHIAVTGTLTQYGKVVLSLQTATPSAPYFTEQPSSVTAEAGDYIYFYAYASGTAPVMLQWRYNGNPIAGATNNNYTISNVQSNHAGIYTIVASNGVGSTVSSNALLSVISVPPPPNDLFENRIAIAGTNLAVTGTNRGATKESGEPNHHNITGGKSVWWTWVAPMNGMVTIDTAGSSFDTVLAVYTGGSVGTLSAVASNDDSGGYTSAVSFAAVEGMAYQIAVDGYAASSGSVVLNVQQVAGTPSVYLYFQNLAGTDNSQTFYQFSVLPGVSSLEIRTFGGSGDCDIYVRYGAPPTLTVWDYCPYLGGNEETVTVPDPAAGTWHIMLHGYNSYSGVTLIAE